MSRIIKLNVIGNILNCDEDNYTIQLSKEIETNRQTDDLEERHDNFAVNYAESPSNESGTDLGGGINNEGNEEYDIHFVDLYLPKEELKIKLNELLVMFCSYMEDN